MIDKINEAFAFRQAALSLRTERQEVLSANIANADTPGYKARDIDFRGELARAMGPQRQDKAGLAMNTTAAGHLRGQGSGNRGMQDLLYRIPDQPSMDGNTVDMDRERAQFMDNSVRIEASLTMMNSYIQGMRKAMQPE